MDRRDAATAGAAVGPTRRIDLELARMGYLVGPNGKPAHIVGIERIAGDTMSAGATVFWCAGVQDGLTACWSRIILLDPALWCDGEWWRLRRIWTEELGHAAAGRPCERRAAAFQLRYDPALLTPTV